MNKLFAAILLLTPIMATHFIPNKSTHDYYQSKIIVGYLDKGDSIEFQFGNQKTIKVGLMEIDLDKRREEIKRVNIAGEFNGWNPDHAQFAMQKMNNKTYKLVLHKKELGKKGETKQFKFVLNGKYWIEPPAEALNKITGTDRNTNLYIKL
jgi:hypothetical protein